MAVHSGRKAEVHLHAGPVAPRFKLQGPNASGIVYTVDATNGEEMSLFADVLVSVARVSTVLSDVSVSVTNTESADADLMLTVTGTVAMDADLAVIVTGQHAAFADLSVLITHPIAAYSDIEIVIIDSSGGEDDDEFEDYGASGGTRDPALEFLGKGLKFPFTFQRRSGGTQVSTATSSDHAHIHESIRQILGTRKGERFMRPDFGTRLHELIFEPNERVLYGLIRHEVMDALDLWEPRVIVTDVLVGPGDDEHLVLVDISYRLISCQVIGNLVWPFFRELE